MPDPVPEFTVYIVDDDPSIRDALGVFLGLHGFRVAPFASAEDFLGAYAPASRGCLVTDIRLPGISGLELQRALRDKAAELPVVVITAHGDVAAARAAFRSDAIDFVEKPFASKDVLAAVEVAFQRERERATKQSEVRKGAEAWSDLTPRERSVATLMMQGKHNKEIAADLEISPRTVEVHRAHVMQKVGARSLSELIRMVGRKPD